MIERRVFDYAAPILERAMSYGPRTHDLEDVWDAIQDGRMQLWPGIRSVLVTEVLDYPKARAVRGVWAAGEMDELVHFIQPTVVEWAKKQGCNLVFLAGRKGWEKIMAPHGHEYYAVLLSKEI